MQSIRDAGFQSAQLKKRIYRWSLFSTVVLVTPWLICIGCGIGITIAGTMFWASGVWLAVLLGAGLVTIGLLPLLALFQTGRFRKEGLEVRREQCPQLWNLFDDLHNRCRLPMPDQIYLDAQFNASAISVGKHRWSPQRRRIVKIGIPLMLHLDTEQFRSVLAHEMAHHDHRDSESSTRVERMRWTWQQRIQFLNQPSINWFVEAAKRPLRRLAERLWASIDAESMLLSREVEFHADTRAGEATSPKITRHALLRTSAIGAMLDTRLQANSNARVARAAVPDQCEIESVDRLIRESYQDSNRSIFHRIAITKATWYLETHPSLKERWLHLGGTMQELRDSLYPTAIHASAASDCLGDRLMDLRHPIEMEVAKQARHTWSVQHHHAKELFAQIDRDERMLASPEFDAKSKHASNVIAVVARIAEKRFELGQIELVLEDLSNVPFPSGSALLDRVRCRCWAIIGDVRCEQPLLEISNSKNLNDAYTATNTLLQYYWTVGDDQSMVDSIERSDAIQKQLERGITTGRRGKYRQHVLPPEQAEELRSWLESFTKLKTAYLAAEGDGDRHVVAIVAARSGRSQSICNQQLQQCLVTDRRMPARTIICTRGGTYSSIAKKVSKEPFKFVSR